MAENIVDQNTDLSLSEMETGPGKDQQQLPLTSSIAKQQSSFMGNLSDSLSQTIDKEMGTGPKTLAQRLAPALCQAVLSIMILSQVDRYTSQENFNPWDLTEVIK
jgi:hypothetical protein